MFTGQITLFKNIPDAEQLQTTIGASVLPSAGQPLLLANQAGPGSLGVRLPLSLMTPQAGASHESLRAEPPPFTQRFNGWLVNTHIPPTQWRCNSGPDIKIPGFKFCLRHDI